jgi:hypothetical protein
VSGLGMANVPVGTIIAGSYVLHCIWMLYESKQYRGMRDNCV